MRDIPEKVTAEVPIELLGSDSASDDIWLVERVEGGTVTLKRVRRITVYGGGGGAGALMPSLISTEA